MGGIELDDGPGKIEACLGEHVLGIENLERDRSTRREPGLAEPEGVGSSSEAVAGERDSIARGRNILFRATDLACSASNSFNGIFVYPRRTAPFGFNGGYYYLRLGFNF